MRNRSANGQSSEGRRGSNHETVARAHAIDARQIIGPRQPNRLVRDPCPKASMFNPRRGVILVQWSAIGRKLSTIIAVVFSVGSEVNCDRIEEPETKMRSTKISKRARRETRSAYDYFAGWSSPVAREAHNLEVVSSNLAPATRMEIGRAHV